jgi:hypothetical protein
LLPNRGHANNLIHPRGALATSGRAEEGPLPIRAAFSIHPQGIRDRLVVWAWVGIAAGAAAVVVFVMFLVRVTRARTYARMVKEAAERGDRAAMKHWSGRQLEHGLGKRWSRNQSSR